MRSVLARPSAAFVRRAPRAFSTSTHKADTHATSRIQSIQESFYETVDRVDVHVPATTANMGPGFDSLGLAMNVYNRLVVTRADKFSMTIEGEGADRIKPSPDNLIVKCVEKGLAAVGQPMVPLHFECQNSVPPTRGMGSSSAALVSGLAAGLALGGKDLSTPATKKLLLQLAADEEGHPDNVAPAIYGGFQVAFRTACPGQWVTQRVNIPTGLQCVLFIPDDEMKTSEARGCLPENLTCAARNSGAIFFARNCPRAIRVGAILRRPPPHTSQVRRRRPQHLSRGDARQLLRHVAVRPAALRDGRQAPPAPPKAHVPVLPDHRGVARGGCAAHDDAANSRPSPRRPPLLAHRLHAPPAAGAHGAFLSGAGPTVLAIAGGVGASGVGTDTMSQFLAEAVSEAMTKEALKHNITGTVHIAQATETGVVSSGYSKDGAVLWSESGKRKLVAGAPQGVKASD